jgi:hypothetical protein
MSEQPTRENLVDRIMAWKQRLEDDIIAPSPPDLIVAVNLLAEASTLIGELLTLEPDHEAATQSGDQPCVAMQPTDNGMGYMCTRAAGHTRMHVAAIRGGAVLARWDQ